jgi:hypothetical protein
MKKYEKLDLHRLVIESPLPHFGRKYSFVGKVNSGHAIADGV